MPLRNLVMGAALIALSAGCGRGTYDDKLDQAIRKAKNPPVEEAADDAAKDDAAKDAAEGDAAKGDEAGKN
jgi:hypothetical protein